MPREIEERRVRELVDKFSTEYPDKTPEEREHIARAIVYGPKRKGMKRGR